MNTKNNLQRIDLSKIDVDDNLNNELSESNIENPFKIDESSQSNIFITISIIFGIIGLLMIGISLVYMFISTFNYNRSSYFIEIISNFISGVLLITIAKAFDYLHIVCKAVIENNTFLKENFSNDLNYKK